MADHSFRRVDLRHWKVEVAFFGEVEKLCDAPALRMDQEFGVPVLFELPVNDIRRDASMNVTLSRPDLHLPRSGPQLETIRENRQHSRRYPGLPGPDNCAIV